jgi:hypothetical protein
MYETANPYKRRNFLQRHRFVITISIIGLIVVGIVVGVLIVKVVLDRPKTGGDGGVYGSLGRAAHYVCTRGCETADPFLTRTSFANLLISQVASFLSTHYATPSPTS